MIANIQCSQCGASFEQNIEGKTSLCPHCGQETPNYIPQPKPLTPKLPPPKTAGYKKSTAKELREQAAAIEFIAKIMAGIGAVIFLLAFFTALIDEKVSPAIWLLSSGLVSSGLVVYVAAQIIHIRANTQKEP